METKDYIKSDIKLTIGILVSNHKEHIRKVMESIKPLLDRLPSELIVVDTKGEETDGSIDIVREYTDKIYPFVWCNDFSAARNVTLEHARGEWYLFIDDDEWFEDVEDLVAFLSGSECEEYSTGFFNRRDYVPSGGYIQVVASRLIRRKTYTRFVGRVHEQFNEVPEKIKLLDSWLHHAGYLYVDDVAKEAHQKRNVDLLELEFKEKGYTPLICAQMVQELYSVEKTKEEGYQYALKSVKILEEKGMWDNTCFQWLLTSLVRYHAIKDNYADALERVNYIHKNFRYSRMAELVMSGMLMECAYATKKYEAMVTHAKEYLAQWDWLSTHQDVAVKLLDLDFSNYYRLEYCFSMLYLGACAANELEQYETALEFWKRFPWEHPQFEGEKYYGEMNRTLKALKKKRGESEDTEAAVEDVEIEKEISMKKTKYPALIKSDIKLTVGILVSNHKKYIRRVMEGLKPLLEAVPSELVVIDTVGPENSDGSIDIVREYTDKIYRFEWCNDFSAARNFCLSKANGEWFMYQDDDEWFDNVQEFIDFFNGKESDEYHTGFYYTRDYLSDRSYSTGIAGRVIRRTERTAFTGMVHEHFAEVFAPNKEFSCFTHHYGYAYETEEQKAAKQERNVSILKKEIEKCGLTAGGAAQMVQELIAREATLEEGYRYCLDSLKKLPKDEIESTSCGQWLLLAIPRYFSMKGDKEAVIREAEKLLEMYKLSNVAKLCLGAVVALAAVLLENQDMAEKYCTMYLEQWDWRKANPEKALEQTNLDLPLFWNDRYYYNILHIAAATANNKGEYRKAFSFWKRMPLGQEGFDSIRYAAEMNRTLQGLKSLQ